MGGCGGYIKSTNLSLSFILILINWDKPYLIKSSELVKPYRMKVNLHWLILFFTAILYLTALPMHSPWTWPSISRYHQEGSRYFRLNELDCLHNNLCTCAIFLLTVWYDFLVTLLMVFVPAVVSLSVEVLLNVCSLAIVFFFV